MFSAMARAERGNLFFECFSERSEATYRTAHAAAVAARAMTATSHTRLFEPTATGHFCFSLGSNVFVTRKGARTLAPAQTFETNFLECFAKFRAERENWKKC